MANENPGRTLAPLRDAVLWTLAPVAFFFLALLPINSLRLEQVTKTRIAAVVLLVDVIGQSIALNKCRKIGKGFPVWQRAVGILCSIACGLLIFLWAVWLAMAGYYAIHPNAPPMFGG